MSLNFNQIGKNIVQVIGGKYDKKIISVSSEIKETKDDFKSFNKLNVYPGKLQQIPDINTERSILYITGASGSGKSTYTKNYILKYKKLFPDNKVYVFSALKEDESLDEIKPLRILIDNTLVSDPIVIDDFKNSLVVYDDIDVISDKKQREAVYNILNQALEVGRHHNISVIITSHLATAGKDTRRVLNEAHFIIWFPFSGSSVGLRRLLEDYCGLDPKTIKYVKTLKSRWACLCKHYPQVIFTESDIWLPSELEL